MKEGTSTKSFHPKKKQINHESMNVTTLTMAGRIGERYCLCMKQAGCAWTVNLLFHREQVYPELEENHHI